MPLPLSTNRQPLHNRTITLNGYKRDDGLYDIEGHLLDTKSVGFTVAGQSRNAGDAVHSMWLRITVDRTLTIVDAVASSDAMPYEGVCNTITPEYKQLIGLAIRPGFTNRVKELLGGKRGCTHLTELIGSLATTAFQTMAGQGMQNAEQKPFQLDGCHALRSDGVVAATYYPRWYTGEKHLLGEKANTNTTGAPEP